MILNWRSFGKLELDYNLKVCTIRDRANTYVISLLADHEKKDGIAICVKMCGCFLCGGYSLSNVRQGNVGAFDTHCGSSVLTG